jgi:diguanylate cyclase (GGDEF)-like protein/PAS domain S-box-containing protein
MKKRPSSKPRRSKPHRSKARRTAAARPKARGKSKPPPHVARGLSRGAKAGGPAAEIASLSQRYAQILAAATNGIIAVDAGGVITAANPAAAEIFDRDLAAMHGLPVARVFVYGGGHPRAGEPVPIGEQIARGPYHVDIEAKLARTDGRSFDAAYAIAPIVEGRSVTGTVITIRDVTERRRLAAEQRVAAAVFEHSTEGLVVADVHGRVTKTNPAFCRMTQLTASEAARRPLFALLGLDAKTEQELRARLETAAQAEIELWRDAGNGRRHAWRVGLSAIRDERGHMQQFAAIISDVTARKLEEERILYQANYDALTGLPNRTLFNERLRRLVIESRRSKSNVGLMFIDLDGFKAINDTLGHDAGDALLKGAAERLLKSVREADTVARLGGDEFTVIMPLLDSLEGAARVAARILAALTRPFDLNGHEGRVSASIGISICPGQAATAEQLLHNADAAMYHAKRQGKANYQIWTPAMEDAGTARN